MNKKNALIVTSVASMVGQFIIPSIKLLIAMGYDVDVATNFIKGSTCSDGNIRELIEQLNKMGVDCYQIDFDRKVMDIRADLKAFKQVNEVVKGSAEPVNTMRHHHITKEYRYTFIHSHSPIGGVVGRIIGKRHKIKNIYTAHGFHFYDGAPRKNWLIFYPIEKRLSRITDVLITINKEDYKRATEKFKAKKTVYIPGIGIDVEKFQNVMIKRENKRAELGLKSEDRMLLSVGELNGNKNHRVVVEALGLIEKSERRHLHYFIAGKDTGKRDKLVKLAKELDVSLHLLGFRTDIPELLKAADFFLLPSIREGLNVGLMEAMASGLPCIASDIRGNRDVLSDEVLFNPHSSGELKNVIMSAIKNSEKELDYKYSLSSISKAKINEDLKKEYMLM